MILRPAREKYNWSINGMILLDIAPELYTVIQIEGTIHNVRPKSLHKFGNFGNPDPFIGYCLFQHQSKLHNGQMLRGWQKNKKICSEEIRFIK